MGLQFEKFTRNTRVGVAAGKELHYGRRTFNRDTTHE